MTLVRFKNQNHNSFFPSILNTFLNEDFINLEKRPAFAATNVKETDAAFELEIIAPGFQKEDFSINLEKGAITISAETKTTDEAAEKGYSRKEFHLQSFKRAFSLPENVDENGISAKYEQGILKLSLTKKVIHEIAVKQISVN